MFTEDINVKQQEGKKFDLLPKGSYTMALKDIELKDSKFKDEETGVVKKQFTFLFTVMGGQSNGRLYWQNFVPTELYVSKKAGKNLLFLIVEALLARQITQREMIEGLSKEFFSALIGKQCVVFMGIIEKDGNTFNRVADWSPCVNTDAVEQELMKTDSIEASIPDFLQ